LVNALEREGNEERCIKKRGGFERDRKKLPRGKKNSWLWWSRRAQLGGTWGGRSSTTLPAPERTDGWKEEVKGYMVSKKA